MILIASFLLIAGSLFWAATFRLTNKTAYLLAVYLLNAANIILTTYIANTFLALNRQSIVLAIHFFILLIGWGVWQRLEKPKSFTPFSDGRSEVNAVLTWLKENPVISAFLIGISAVYLFGFAQVLFIPQNSMDGLSTYLSRVGFWLQNGSFFPWETNAIGQIVYPVNAQLPIFWTALFTGGDQLAGMIQWVAVLVSGLSVFGLSQVIGYTRQQAAFAGLVYLSLPIVVLQSTTVQTDMLTAVYFIMAMYFLAVGLKENKNSYLILFSISSGLGVGTKKSFLILLPVLALSGILLVIAYKRSLYKKLSFLLISSLIGITVFGAYLYIMNWHFYGSPVGNDYVNQVLQWAPGESPVIRARSSATAHPSATGNADGSDHPSRLVEELEYNIPRILYQFIDVSGLPRPLSGHAHKAKAAVARAIFDVVGFEEIEGNTQTAAGHSFDFSDKNDATENAAWYGPLGFLLVLPAMLVGFRAGIQEKNALKLLPLLGFLIFLPLEVILRPGWDPYQGRYFAPIIALNASLLGEIIKPKKGVFLKWSIVMSALLFAGVSILYNPAKPTLGKFADEFHIWTNDRVFVQTIQRRKERELYVMVEEFVEPEAVLAYQIDNYLLNYPLFGKNFSRTLIPVRHAEQLQDIQWAKENGIDYLLIEVTKPVVIPDEYRVVDDVRLWQLYRFEGD